MDFCAACCLLWAVIAAQPPDTVWTRRYDVEGWEDDALEVVADSAGNVFLFGLSTDTSYRGHFFIVKYRSDGTTLLVRTTRYEPICDWDGGIAIDPEGKVIIAYPSDEDYVVSKYAPDADTLWTRRFDTGDSDHPYDVACDRSGNIVVTGRSYNTRVGSSLARLGCLRPRYRAGRGCSAGRHRQQFRFPADAYRPQGQYTVDRSNPRRRRLWDCSLP